MIIQNRESRGRGPDTYNRLLSCLRYLSGYLTDVYLVVWMNNAGDSRPVTADGGLGENHQARSAPLEPWFAYTADVLVFFWRLLVLQDASLGVEYIQGLLSPMRRWYWQTLNSPETSPDVEARKQFAYAACTRRLH
jgi:hypothetical protein